jgi:hypothetical protein
MLGQVEHQLSRSSKILRQSKRWAPSLTALKEKCASKTSSSTISSVWDTLRDSSYPWYLTVRLLCGVLMAECIACGYIIDDKRMEQLNEFLDENKASRIDLNTMLTVLTHLKELNLMNEQENEGDEYCK